MGSNKVDIGKLLQPNPLVRHPNWDTKIDNSDHGRRSMLAMLDKVAQQHGERPWASVPIDSDDLAKGYKDINFKQLRNATENAAHWLDRTFGKCTPTASQEPPCLSYIGPPDLQYAVLILAVYRSGRRLLLASPFASLDAQIHLYEKTNAECLIYAPEMEAHAKKLLERSREQGKDCVKAKETPRFNDFDRLSKTDEREPYPFTKTWDESSEDVVCITHTSGSTGLPKPVPLNNEAFAFLDIVPYSTEFGEVMNAYAHSRVLSATPPAHTSSVFFATTLCIFFSCTYITIPPRLATPEDVYDAAVHGNADQIMATPAFIARYIEDPVRFESLRKLKALRYVGAPLPPKLSRVLSEKVKLYTGYGSSEGGVFIEWNRPDDLPEDDEGYHGSSYHNWHPLSNIELRHQFDDKYEVVIKRGREPGWSRFQRPFKVYKDKDLDEFPMGDLFVQHSHSDWKDWWKYYGRVDDMIVMSDGGKFHSTALEDSLAEADNRIKALVIGETGRPKPYILLELADPSLTVDDLWPSIEKHFNGKQSNTRSYMTKPLVLLIKPANGDKPLVRTEKGNTARRPSLKLYAGEIQKLYERAGMT